MADSKLYLFAFVNFFPGKYSEWQAAYDDLAVYVHTHETSTQSYYFGIPFDHADNFDNTEVMLAFEVYDDRNSLYQTHFVSDAMQTFLPRATPAMATGFDLQHYSFVAGNLDRLGDARPCGLIHDTKIVCQDRGVVLERLKNLAAAILQTDPETVLSWLALVCDDNDTDVRIFARYRDRQAKDATDRLEAVMAFWTAGKGEGGAAGDVVRIEQRGYVENGKGWLHR